MKVTEWCPHCGQEANYNVKKGWSQDVSLVTNL